MAPINHLVPRDDGARRLDTTQVALITSLLVLVLLSFILVAALVVVRRMRRTSKQTESDAQLPFYKKIQSNCSRLTIATVPYSGRESVVVSSEKQGLVRTVPGSPSSPVPEIRITFPDEVDESGQRQSGRVVVVRVGEHSVGLEPVQENLPQYQRDQSDRFDSLDLDRIGGLKEKDNKDYL